MRRVPLFWLLVVLLSMMQFHLYYELHRNDAAFLAARATDVIRGQSDWRAYESRLLGPALVAAMSRVVGSDRTAFLVFAALLMFVAHAAAGSIALHYLRRHARAAVGVCVFSLSYAMLFDRWSYPWDFIDVVVFLLFSHVVLERRRMFWILPIFLTALLNRESSLFIGAWFVIEPIIQTRMNRDAPLRRGRIALGLVLTLASVWFVTATRQLLTNGRATGRSAAAELATGNVVTLSYNLSAFHFRGLLGLCLFLTCVLFVAGFASQALARSMATDLAFGALLALVLSQMLLFAVLSETRVFYTIQAMIFVAGLKWVRNATQPAES